MLFDNSLSSGPHLLMRIRDSSIEENHLDRADIFHCRLAEAASKALSMPTDAVFRAARP